MSDLDRPAVSRPLLIGLGAVVVLALLWLFVLGPAMSGSGDDEVFVPPRPRPTIAVPSPSPVPEDPLYPETDDVFAARDPFSQLVARADAGGAGAPGAPAPGGTATPPATSGGVDGGGGGAGSGGAGTERPPSGSSAEVGGTQIKLIDVYDDAGRAVITVNGRSYDVAEGETFARRFRLLDLTGECGTFLFGDSRFVLCEGDEIRK